MHTDPEVPTRAEPEVRSAPAEAHEPETLVKTGVRRWLLLSLGIVLTAFGTVGAFLPVLPTTPFVLLAAACFARSSPAFHKRLLQNRVIGKYLVEWQREHTVPREAKRKAVGLVVVSFTLSIFLISSPWLRGGLLVVGLGLVVFLSRLPSSERKSS